ncbi:MAG: hypothetical protein AAGH41_02280 [Pseudomonadota bacterium]
MNIRVAIGIKSFAFAAIASVSGAVAGDLPSPSETAAPNLPLTEAMIDAARSFGKFDVNRDGMIDADEYASQRVVVAHLSRFRRSISIDGQTALDFDLPEDVPMRLGASEKAAIEAVARRDFQVRAFGSAGLETSAWQESQLERFYLADEDGDGVLQGPELVTYVRGVAGQLQAGLPVS